MKFEEVLPALRAGKKISYKKGMREVCFDKNTQGFLFFEAVLSDDWEILKENKSFADVLPAFKEGKKIRRITWSRDFYIQKDREMELVNVFNFLYNDWEIIDEV